MNAFTRELVIVGVLVVIGALIAGAWVSQSGGRETPPISQAPGADVQDSQLTPATGGELRLVTATPSASAAVTREVPTATPVPIAIQTAPAVPTAAPPSQPAVPTSPPPAPQAPATTTADFTGRWRITDTITEGTGAGQVFTFDVTLQQNGTALSGGNSGIQITGAVQGQTAVLSYNQPPLGHTGTFTWMMAGLTSAQGTFTSSVPNSGTSSLQRLP